MKISRTRAKLFTVATVPMGLPYEDVHAKELDELAAPQTG